MTTTMTTTTTMTRVTTMFSKSKRSTEKKKEMMMTSSAKSILRRRRRNYAPPNVAVSSSSSSRGRSNNNIDWENDIVSRHDVTELIVFNRMKMNISWAELALTVNKSKEWTTSALLGQHQMSKEEAEKVGTVLALPSVAVKLLQTVPYKGSLPTSVPTDPLIYRFYELVNVYGTTFKELIHEEFGDGIMSAIDFNMNLSKKKGDLGEDRVSITMSGKYLPYKKY
jgi:cyanate lyase